MMIEEKRSMFASKTVPTPFTDDDDIAGAVPVVVSSSRDQTANPSVVAAQKYTPRLKEAELMRDPQKRTELDRDRRDDPNAKRQKHDKDGMPHPPPNAPAIMFAKYGHAHASEAEVHDWSSASVDANHAGLTNCLGEAFIKQASHARDIKGLASTNTKLYKENQALKYKVDIAEDDKKNLCDKHKDNVKLETAWLRKELREANAKVASLEKAQEEVKLLAEAEAKKH